MTDIPNASETLVVPEKVASGFMEQALAKPIEVSHPVKSDNVKDKILHCTKKSTLITAPVLSTLLTVGSFHLSMAALGDNIFLYMGGILGASFSIIGGIGGIAVGATSIVEGNRNFAPLPVSKKYRESQEQAKEEANKLSIAPFDEWDTLFDQNFPQAIESNK